MHGDEHEIADNLNDKKDEVGFFYSLDGSQNKKEDTDELPYHIDHFDDPYIFSLITEEFLTHRQFFADVNFHDWIARLHPNEKLCS